MENPSDNREQSHLIPCETCGRPTTFLLTRRCGNCLTVEALLPEYLRSEMGRAFVEKALKEAHDGK